MSNIGSIMQTLDLRSMLSSPFIAAQEAQAQVASSTLSFLQSYAFEKDSAGNNTDELRTFSVNTFVDDPVDSSNGVIVQKKKTLTLPILTLLNVPALQISKVEVDLTIKIESQTSSQSQSSLDFTAGMSIEAAARYNVLFSSGSASASADTRVTSSNSSKDSIDSNSSAKYDIRMTAENKQPPGLAMIMDFCNRTDGAPDRSKIKPTSQI